MSNTEENLNNFDETVEEKTDEINIKVYQYKQVIEEQNKKMALLNV